MKAFLTLMACLLTFGAMAQQPTVPAGRDDWSGKVMDTTITNVATPGVVVPVIGSKSAVTFQYNITKNSGTVAGTIVLYGSIDGGTTWATINSYTLTDATASTSLTYSHAGYSKYKVIVTTSGTLSANVKVYALYRSL